MRTIVEIEDTEAARLDAWAKAQNVSRTEAVRRAVRLMLDQAALPQGAGFGLWGLTETAWPYNKSCARNGLSDRFV
jgi:metal-responsive CopG/Arc/MetJ family transcriptional regulator